MNSNIILKIIELNNTRLGSFGEYIFLHINKNILNKTIEKKHSQRTDFMVNNKAVDVKTTKKNITKDNLSLKLYRGDRVNNILYSQVEFLKSNVRISIEEEILYNINYPEVEKLYNQWIKKIGISVNVNNDSEYKTKIQLIKGKIRTIFNTKGYSTRIIYRTNQNSFGAESPDNLKPKIIKEKNITIFLDFKDFNISEKNINMIYVFKDKESNNLPLLDKPKLHKEKVNLYKLDEKYKFKNIHELENYSF